MAMDAIETIKASETQAEKSIQDALKKADELVAKARAEGEALVKDAVASAREKIAAQVKSAAAKAEEEYRRLLGEYANQIGGGQTVSQADRARAVDAVIREMMN